MTEHVEGFIETVANSLDGDDERAIVAVCAMVGALALSRVVVEPGRSNTISSKSAQSGRSTKMTERPPSGWLPEWARPNWLTRANRVLSAKLDAFAFELLTFLSMGQALQASTPARAPKPGTVTLTAVQ